MYKHICEIPLNYILREKFCSAQPFYQFSSWKVYQRFFMIPYNSTTFTPPLHLSLLSTRLEFQLSRLPAYYCKLQLHYITNILLHWKRNIPQMLTHHQQFTMGAVSTNTTPTKHSIANIHTIEQRSQKLLSSYSLLTSFYIVKGFFLKKGEKRKKICKLLAK